MKRIQLLGSVVLTGAFLFGLTLIRYPAAVSNRIVLDNSNTLDSPDVSRTPVRYMRLLPLVAQPLAYLPKMEQAIAAHSPTQQKAASPFKEAEVTLFGVEPLRVGMTLAEAQDALGVPLTPLGGNLSGECAYYRPETDTQSLGVMVVDDRIIRIDIWPGSTLATVSGAHIGISEESVMEIYPDQIEAAPNPYTQGKFLTLVPSEPELSLYRMVFETDPEGKVVQYRTGQFPAVTWPDGCV